MFLPRTAAIFFLVAAPWAAISSYACQCREKQPPCAEYWKADAVFVGQVEKIARFDPRTSHYSTEFDRVLFKVSNRYRGVTEDRLELYDWETSCRYGFSEGKTYLVYAYRNEQGILSTHYCSRTTEISSAATDLDYFALVSTGQQKQQIVGALIDGNKILIGAPVVATSGAKTYRTNSGDDGWFRLDVEPGTYRTRLFLPPTTDAAGTSDLFEKIAATARNKNHYVIEFKVNVPQNQCAFIDAPIFIPNTPTTQRKSGK